MLKTTNQRVAVALFFFSTLYLVFSFQLPSYPFVPIDSDIIPTGLGILLMILSMALYFEKEKEKAADSNENKIPWQETKMLLAVFGMIILYIFVFELLGFVVSTVLFIFCCSRFLGYKNHLVNAAVSIIFPLIIYFAFTKGLQVVLPQGILPF